MVGWEYEVGGEERDLGGPRLSQLSPPTERTRRGVQIPLPEGMDFVREVVTNHAVSGGTMGKEGRAFLFLSRLGAAQPDRSSSLINCSLPF